MATTINGAARDAQVPPEPERCRVTAQPRHAMTFQDLAGEPGCQITENDKGSCHDIKCQPARRHYVKRHEPQQQQRLADEVRHDGLHVAAHRVGGRSVQPDDRCCRRHHQPGDDGKPADVAHRRHQQEGNGGQGQQQRVLADVVGSLLHELVGHAQLPVRVVARQHG